jgi:hypothetical protein
MKDKTWITLVIMCALLLALSSSTGALAPAPQGEVGAQEALGTAITYQGHLTDNGAPAEGAYDLRFGLYDVLEGGSPINTIDVGLDVVKGVFTVELDFGARAFDGSARYLEIGARAGESTDPYTTLTPRQPLTAAPYALYALASPADAEIEALERRIVSLECLQGYGNCKFVFLTHGWYDGNLGGLAGGDAICQGAANAAGLAGTYKAWLSTASASPSTRFARAAVPYILPDGTWVAENWADLTDGSILSPIDRGPDGQPVQLRGVGYDTWTATMPDGTPDTYSPIRDCTGWTGSWYGMLGDATAVGGQWSYDVSYVCSQTYHLYCFGQ